jgi:hypothetical protein
MIAIPRANFASGGSECSHSQAIVKKLIDWFLQGEIVLSLALHAEMTAATVRKHSKRPVIGSTEKRMPAMAAARGVFKRARIKVASCFIWH